MLELELTVKNKPLTIGYSALAERVKNIIEPSISIGHDVFISIQNPNGLEFELPKGYEFRSVEANQVGVAKSRNVVLNTVETEYLLFADDEIIFIDEGVKEVVAYLDSNPGCDMVLAQAMDHRGALRKRYPRKKINLSKYNSAKAATYEMIVRVKSIKSRGVSFDEKFGAGVENYLGDEYIFISDLIDQGGKGVFLPVTIAIHPEESSGSQWGSERDLQARARVFQRIFGKAAVFVRTAFYLKNFRKFQNPKNALKFISGNF